MSAPRTRLDQAMDTRRLDLGKQWKDIANEAGVSTAALGAIRRGEYKPSPLTARRLEDALQWQHGSIDAILADGEPTPIEQAPSDEHEPTVAALAAQLAEQKRVTAEQERRFADLERRFDELLAQREAENKRRGKAG